MTDYPRLDYLICFVSEGSGGDATWHRIFHGFYDGIKKRSPRTRLAVAGWGLDAEPVAKLPADVDSAPISAYSDRCESGAIYGNREYWGCPWLERDGNCSEYYYPYNIHLSNTIKAWQGRAPNMKGVLLPDMAVGRRHRSEDLLHRKGAVGPRRQVQLFAGGIP